MFVSSLLNLFIGITFLEIFKYKFYSNVFKKRCLVNIILFQGTLKIGIVILHMNLFSSSWELYSHHFFLENYSILGNTLYPKIKFSKFVTNIGIFLNLFSGIYKYNLKQTHKVSMFKLWSWSKYFNDCVNWVIRPLCLFLKSKSSLFKRVSQIYEWNIP